MRIIAINGSPRKNWNTATLLNKVLDGAASKGSETEFIHLYDLNYKGCISCFSCKLKDGKSYGRCAVNDDLKEVFKKIEEADAIILGSPIYCGSVTGEMRSFLERLIMQYGAYDNNHSNLLKKRMPVHFVYTMNATESQLKAAGYEKSFRNSAERYLETWGPTESLFVTDTFQFDDYSKYVASIFDMEKKEKRRKEEFPKDCEKAFGMGIRIVDQIKNS